MLFFCGDYWGRTFLWKTLKKPNSNSVSDKDNCGKKTEKIVDSLYNKN